MSGNAGISRASGSGKSTTKGQSVKVVKTKQRKTKEIDEKILTLRSAIFSSNGKDKDVSEGISPAFMNYTRNGLNLHIIFSTRLQRRELNWAFGLVKENMEERYDNSGYGWDDDDKERELSEDCTRFLLVQDRDQNNRMIGFVHFRFSVEGDIMDVMAGETSTFLWDIHIEENYQHKGLGKHLVTLLELITRREKISQICIPVQNEDDVALSWVQNALKGYKPHDGLDELLGFDSEAEGFNIYHKTLVPAAKKAQPAVNNVFNFAGTPEKGKKDVDPKVKELTKSVMSLNFSEEASMASSATAIPENEEVEDSEEVEELKLDEHDIINGLKVMYKEKNGKDATDVEVDQWLIAIRGGGFEFNAEEQIETVN